MGFISGPEVKAGNTVQHGLACRACVRYDGGDAVGSGFEDHEPKCLVPQGWENQSTGIA